MKQQPDHPDIPIGDLKPIEPFEPAAFYNPDGDCVEFLISNEPHFARRIDGWVTVYYSEESGNIVGGLIKGVKNHLLRKFPGMRLDFEGDQVEIAVLLCGPAWTNDDEIKQKTYKAVLDKVRSHPVFAELATC